MKVIIIIILVIFCCVALLPSIVHGDDERKLKFLQFLKYLDQNAAMGAKGELINGIFRLSKDGHLGIGEYSLAYKAEFEADVDHKGKEVALKFTPMEQMDVAFKEYKMYTYLNAIDNQMSEAFGVPTVYYYHSFSGYIVMAISLVNQTFNERLHNRELTMIDIFIIFREFTKISKYIHSMGVLHNDIKPDNIMFDGQQAFIIDYNSAEKLETTRESESLRYLSRGAHLMDKRCAKGDWESFLYSACSIAGLDLAWFNLTDMDAIYALKQNTLDTVTRIHQFPLDSMKKVYIEFTKYAFIVTPTGYPDYDQFYEFIKRQIGTSEFGTWLTADEWKKAICELKTKPFTDLPISQIPKPVPRSSYPNADPFYFFKKYHSHLIHL